MKKLTIMLICLAFATAMKAQILNPVKWSYAAKRTGSTEATILVRAKIDGGWHIYSVNQKEGGPQKTNFTFTPAKDYALIGKVAEPKPISKHEEVFNMQVDYFEKSVTFSQKIKLKAKQTIIKGKIEYMVCTDKECLPPAEVEFSIPVK